MSIKSTRARVLAAPILELDWQRRFVDGLVHGMSHVSVPVSGGTARSWGALVADLQNLSVSPTTAPDAFHLIGADRHTPGGMLELGVHNGYSDPSMLQMRLALAVSRANRMGHPVPLASPPVGITSASADALLA